MPVAVIDEQHIRSRVVADIEVFMAVPVVVQRDHGHGPMRRQRRDARRLAGVGAGSVAVVDI